jgi:hypothetical protein
VAGNELELSALIFKGYLPEEDRNDARHIGHGLRSTAGADLLSERGSVKRVPRIGEFGCNASQYSAKSRETSNRR